MLSPTCATRSTRRPASDRRHRVSDRRHARLVRELQPGIVFGDWVRAEYGVAAGELSRPAVLTVRRASRACGCVGCGNLIPRGTLHGSGTGVHYCAGCVTDIEPESTFKTKAA